MLREGGAFIDRAVGSGTGPVPLGSWLPVPRPVPHRWLLLALLGALLLARQPHELLRPQFTAEAGEIFFQQAYNDGFLPSLLRSESGYYHLTLRLTAGLALLVPLELAPLVFTLASFAIQMLPVAYLLADGVTGVVAAPLFRAAAAALYVAAPNSGEVSLNVNNSQWHLTLAACLILLSGPGAGRVRRMADACVLLLFAFSGPFSLVCAPLALWALWRRRRHGAAAVAALGPGIALAGAVLQAAYLLTGSRVIGGAQEFGVPAIGEIIRIIGLQGAFQGVMGRTFMWSHHEAVPALAYSAAALVFPALACVAVRLRNLPLAVLLGLAASSVAVMLLFPLQDPRLWLSPKAGPRYFFFAGLSILYALLAMAERGGWWRRVAVPLLALAVLSGVRGDFRIPVEIKTHWRDQVAVFRTLPAGTSFYIPIYPQPRWGVTLVKKGPEEPLKLKRFPLSDRRLLSAVAVGFADPPFTYVRFKGFAVDDAAKAAAGGVWLRVDERLYPAVTHLPSPLPAMGVDERILSTAGFFRYVPRDELGPGPHRVQVFALDRARTALLEPGPYVDFTLP